MPQRPQHRVERQPSNKGELICVAMLAVSIMSLMPIGIPSIADSGLRPPSAVDVSAAARASSILTSTNAPRSFAPSGKCSRGSVQGTRARVSPPKRIKVVAARNGPVCGTARYWGQHGRPHSVIARTRRWLAPSRFAAGIDGAATDRMRFHAVHRDYRVAHFGSRASQVASCW